MAVVGFDKKLLKKLGVEIEGMTAVIDSLGMEVEKDDANEIHVDITPNRPDMLDIVGFARAINYYSEKRKPKEGEYSIKADPATYVEVTESARRIRPVIAAMVIRNIDLKGGMLKQMINFMEKISETYGRKRRKIAMGMHNIDAVNPPFKYDAISAGSFVPLGFETEMEIEQIMKEHAKGIDYGYTIKGKGAYPVLMDSKGRIMSLIPIINSSLTKVKESTKNLLIDVTGSSNTAVANVINMLACSFVDLGATVEPCIIKSDGETVTPQISYMRVTMRPRAAMQAIGARIDSSQMTNALARMGIDSALYGSKILAFVPPYRVDILGERDIIEDTAIGYGYSKINPYPVFGSSIGLEEESKVLSNKIANIMVGLGFSEAINPYLTNQETNFAKMQKAFDPEKVVRIAYSKVETFTMLRTSVLPSILKNIGASGHEPMPFRIFEIGKVFSVENGRAIENDSIAFAIVDAKASFSYIKASVESLLGLCGIKYSLKECSDPSFIEGRCASIISDGMAIGLFGELSPAVIEGFSIGEPVACAEIMMLPLMSALASLSASPARKSSK
ncbi:MAG: phenylalanine--tRNA ligase subunit beta [Candidatus Micrarchaeia archaeon]